jgi:hypothetical protein
MTNRSTFLSLIGAVSAVALLGASPATAGVAISYVSGNGSDAGGNVCSNPATPCRSFAYALGQTNANGEVKALDPADYGPVSITKSITITGVPGASIHRTTAGTAISIDQASAIVSLRGIEINGHGVATNGIVVVNAQRVSIVDCVVRRIAADGISISPSSGAVSATISNTISSNNGNFGIQFVPGGGATVSASIDHSTMNDNGFAGVLVSPNATVTIFESFADNNSVDGYRAVGSAKMRIGRSVATGNGVGVDNVSNATVQIFNDNTFAGNGTNVSGATTTVAMF